MSDKPVTLAAITGAHGVAGEVRLKLFGDGLATLKQHKSFNDGALTLKKVRDDNKGGGVARFAEVADRTAAEKLRGTVLSVSRENLPALEEGEYYHADLLGLAVVSDTGEDLGKVIDVQNFGAGDVIEIQRPAQGAKPGKKFMVPMRTHAVISWDDISMIVSGEFAED